ncbi:MAG TPA: hypothetical protein VFB35_06180 [Gaiellaceae bacterium]|nr:hypothetical protein [Gaiellaceae bacterium]
MIAAPPHEVPAGPLGVRWLEFDLDPVQAGAAGRARLRLRNAGTAAWRDLLAAYHWLDGLGNAIHWDGLRTPVPPLAPGEAADLELRLRGPMPPGTYRLAFDLVLEHRYWLSEIGNSMLETDVAVGPRDASGAVAHLPERVEPADGWHELVRAAHEEGFAAVGGAVDGRERALRPYRPGGGRNPLFAEPLVCPSLLPPLAPNCEVAGLPAWALEGDEPWIYDGRISARVRR